MLINFLINTRCTLCLLGLLAVGGTLVVHENITTESQSARRTNNSSFDY